MISPETLREYPYFKWASLDTLKTLSMLTEERSYKTGEELFRGGEPAEYLYLLIRGEVDIQYPLSSGERRTVDKLGKGDLLVWSAVVEPYMNTSFGVARSDCEVVSIDAVRLRQLLDEDPEFGQSLMSQMVKVVASRLTGARRQLAQLA